MRALPKPPVPMTSLSSYSSYSSNSSSSVTAVRAGHNTTKAGVSVILYAMYVCCDVSLCILHDKAPANPISRHTTRNTFSAPQYVTSHTSISDVWQNLPLVELCQYMDGILLTTYLQCCGRAWPWRYQAMLFTHSHQLCNAEIWQLTPVPLEATSAIHAAITPLQCTPTGHISVPANPSAVPRSVVAVAILWCEYACLADPSAVHHAAIVTQLISNLAPDCTTSIPGDLIDMMKMMDMRG